MAMLVITRWYIYIYTMENGPFIVDLPIKNGDFQQPTLFLPGE